MHKHCATTLCNNKQQHTHCRRNVKIAFKSRIHANDPTNAPAITTTEAFSVTNVFTVASLQTPLWQVPFLPQNVPSRKAASRTTHLPFPFSQESLHVEGVDGQARLIPRRFPRALHCKSRLVQTPDAHLPPESSQVAPSGAKVIAGHSGLIPSHLASN